jgi:hypothetical protein
MPSVSFRDDAGDTWDVHEIRRLTPDNESVRPELVNGWLCFQRADGKKVRVPKTKYPVAWDELSPADLQALLADGLAVRAGLPAVSRRRVGPP